MAVNAETRVTWNWSSGFGTKYFSISIFVVPNCTLIRLTNTAIEKFYSLKMAFPRFRINIVKYVRFAPSEWETPGPEEPVWPVRLKPYHFLGYTKLTPQLPGSTSLVPRRRCVGLGTRYILGASGQHAFKAWGSFWPSRSALSPLEFTVSLYTDHLERLLSLVSLIMKSNMSASWTP